MNGNAYETPLRVIVNGAAGAMGRILCGKIEAAPDLTLAAVTPFLTKPSSLTQYMSFFFGA